MKLNENDNKLLAFCMDKRQSVNDIAKFLNITPASISVRINKLEKEGLIIVERRGAGKKTYVRTRAGDKTKKYFVEILKEIKKRGGEISNVEYFTLIPFDARKPEEQDKFSAPLRLLYTELVDRKVVITKEGEEFLKKHKK